ncbi:hypothetical protein K439DRAFT_1613812 [Ramaria rubella]|nr:hypothetical protein K439DRAFT_1613812 [Ramaria rubella]
MLKDIVHSMLIWKNRPLDRFRRTQKYDVYCWHPVGITAGEKPTNFKSKLIISVKEHRYYRDLRRVLSKRLRVSYLLMLYILPVLLGRLCPPIPTNSIGYDRLGFVFCNNVFLATFGYYCSFVYLHFIFLCDWVISRFARIMAPKRHGPLPFLLTFRRAECSRP